MATCCQTTDEAISSLHATVTQLQHTSARHSATLAGLLRTTASTKATVIVVQSSLNDILLQLALLRQPATRLGTSHTQPLSSVPHFSSPFLPTPSPSFLPQPTLSLFKLPQPSSVSPYPLELDTISSSVACPSTPSLLHCFPSSLKPETHHDLLVLHPSSTIFALPMATRIAAKTLQHRQFHPSPPPQPLLLPLPPTPQNNHPPFGLHLLPSEIQQRCAIALCLTSTEMSNPIFLLGATPQLHPLLPTPHPLLPSPQSNTNIKNPNKYKKHKTTLLVCRRCHYQVGF